MAVFVYIWGFLLRLFPPFFLLSVALFFLLGLVEFSV